MDHMENDLARNILVVVGSDCSLAPGASIDRHVFECNRYAYNQLKHYGYVEWSGMRGCYFCGLRPEEEQVKQKLNYHKLTNLTLLITQALSIWSETLKRSFFVNTLYLLFCVRTKFAVGPKVTSSDSLGITEPSLTPPVISTFVRSSITTSLTLFSAQVSTGGAGATLVLILCMVPVIMLHAKLKKRHRELTELQDGREGGSFYDARLDAYQQHQQYPMMEYKYAGHQYR